MIDKYGIVKKTISVGIVVNVYYCWDLWKSLLALDSVLSAVNKKNSDFFDKALQNRQTIIKELVSLDEQ